MDRRFYWLVMVLLTAAVGGFFGGVTAVGMIGIDPAPFRTAPNPVTPSSQPCYRVDLTGKVIGACDR